MRKINEIFNPIYNFGVTPGIFGVEKVCWLFYNALEISMKCKKVFPKGVNEMKKRFVFLFGIFIFVALLVIPGSVSVGSERMQEIKKQEARSGLTGTGKLQVDLNFGKLPLYFITNKGQVNKKAKFYARASRYTLWLTGEGLVFDSTCKVKVEAEGTRSAPGGHPYSPGFHRDVSRLIFLDANENPEMVPLEETKLRVNYFKGNDKAGWHGNIPTSQAVLYKNLYKNIDLKVYGIEKQIEYDWMVKPGGNPGDIRFEYRSVNGSRLDEEGNLLIQTESGELVHKKPLSYQDSEKRVEVAVKFKKIGENTYRFEVGEYDKGRELIIDPMVLAYSTYLGGEGYDVSWGTAIDAGGYVYVAGETLASDFPLLDQYQAYGGNFDVFITKLDTTQTRTSSLIYSTYLGGESDDSAYGIAVDAGGIAYVAGRTYGTDFPCLNQYMTDPGDSDYDGFVAKLDTTQPGPSGLIYSTYLGGDGEDWAHAIAVDTNGYTYVTGRTSSTDYPCLNQYQTDMPGYDVFVTRLDTTRAGSSGLLYSTYLGGEGWDVGYGIAADAGGNAYVTGDTESTDFPTLNQYMSDPGNGSIRDVFVTKIDTTREGASSLLYSTYLGTGSASRGYGIAADDSGTAYVTGYTSEPDFPLKDQYQTFQGLWDAFVTKLDTTLRGTASLVYSTCLGGEGRDEGMAISIDAGGNVYVTGYTKSTDFPILEQYMSDPGDVNADVFVSKIDTAQAGAAGLIYSTYLGGNDEDIGYGIAGDSSGNVYVTGYTNSTDFPVQNQYMTEPGDGDWDAFVTKLTFVELPTVTTAAVSSSTATSASGGGEVTSDGGAEVTVRGVCWSTSENPTTDDSYTTDGSGTGVFTSSMTGLIPNTYYYVRAYATNSAGTAYGNEETFETLDPSITVTSPNGGENWEVASLHNITWTSDGVEGNVKIEYSTNNGGNWTEIIASTENDGTHPWTVPEAVSDQCLIHISKTDGYPSDTSDNVFTIILPDLTVTSPNGGENWNVGSFHAITWTSQGTVSNVTIEYSINNGGSWRTIVPSTENDGSYNWHVPNRPSGNCLVRVIEQDEDGGLSDVSDAVFSIVSPVSGSVTVRSPNGGETWAAGSSQEIKWNSTGDINQVTIKYSTDNGTTWKAIAQTTGNDGSYNWVVPETASDKCLVRVTANDSDLDPKPSDASDAVFSIVLPSTPGIRVIAPNGGEQLTAGTGFTITWSAANSRREARIEYSVNNGQTWTEITGSSENNGKYDWTVPDEPSDNCLVRISEAGGQPSDTSDGPFSIVQPSVGDITVTSPNGGESWSAGSPQEIKWTGSGIDSVKIEYSRDNGTTWKTIVQTTENDGSFNWTVPDIASAGCLVRITSNDEFSDPKPSDVSDAVFSIVPAPSPTIRVIAPNGGEQLVIGSSINISWDAIDSREDVKIEYSTNGGTTWAIIAGTAENNGDYEWIVPDDPSETCLVRVIETDGDPLDISDAVFAIVQPFSDGITVTAPNGGESWAVDSLQEIKWTGNGEINNVTIEYSTDTGTTWKTVVQTTENDGSFDWTVPDAVSDECLVRVTAYDNDLDPKPTDMSDQLFSIVPDSAGEFRVTSPNGGEEWEVGSTQAITWSGSGDINSLMIEYSPDNGNTWSTIIASVGNRGTYDWLIPATVSNECLVRVSANDGGGDPKPTDISDAVFSIVPPPSPIIRVIAPNGGEQLVIGSRFNITWYATNSREEVKIEYSPNGGETWTTITEAAENDGDYEWIVLAEPSETFLVRISEPDGQPVDISDAVFSIVQPSPSTITVTAPNGGENLEAGSQFDITWTCGDLNNVIIEYSVDDGTAWLYIDRVPADNGSYTWTVPGTPSEMCLVRVSGADADENPWDVSDSVFTIFDPSQAFIEVFTPNGGESLGVGEEYYITWASSGINSVKIEYSTDSGDQWLAIDTVPALGGRYAWTVPDTPSNTCLIRITGNDSAEDPSDVSDALFSIAAQ